MRLRYKCKCCGATALKQIDENTFKCKYCDSIFDAKDEQPKDEPKSQEDKTQEIAKPKFNIEPKSSEEQKSDAWIKKQVLHLILCICFGIFGVHKFLEFKFVQGVIYLCTGGLFGFGIVIDAIVYIYKINRRLKQENK